MTTDQENAAERGPIQLEFIRRRAEEWRKKNAPLPKFPSLEVLLLAAKIRRLIHQRSQP